MWVSAPTLLTTFLNSSVTSVSNGSIGSRRKRFTQRAGPKSRSSLEQVLSENSVEGSGRFCLLASPISAGAQAPCRKRSALPALDQFVVVDGFALRLLVGQLGLGPVGFAEPLFGILDGIEPRPAAAVDLGLLVHVFHARHHVVHLLGEPIHGLLRSEGAGVHVPDVLPPERGECGVVGEIDAGGSR